MSLPEPSSVTDAVADEAELIQPRFQMALFRIPERPNAFRKAVEVVNAAPSREMPPLQRQLTNALIKHAIAHSMDEDGFYVIGMRELLDVIGFKSRNYQHLKKMALDMMSLVYQWDHLSPQEQRPKWKGSVIFPEIEIHRDVMRYQISQSIREHVIDPKVYALIDLNVCSRLSHAASFPIYEICARYQKVGRTARFPVALLLPFLVGDALAKDSMYREYKYLRYRLLKKAIRDINAAWSGFKIDLIEHKSGRTVTEVQFEITRIQPAEAALENEAHIELVTEMTQLGVPRSESRTLVRKHTPETLRAALDYTYQRKNKRGGAPLSNPAAYFRVALEQGYNTAPPISAAKVKQAMVEPESMLRSLFLAHRSQEALTWFNELTADEQQPYLDRYNAQQRLKALKAGARASKAARDAFLHWLAQETWGDPDEASLLRFAAARLAQQEHAKTT